MKFKFLLLSSVLSIFSMQAFAASNAAPANAKVEKTEKSDVKADEKRYTQTVDEYKKYLATVKKEVRDEVVEYRREVARVNKTKIDLYKKLSQEAQVFLAKERELKKKLPIKERKAALGEAKKD